MADEREKILKILLEYVTDTKSVGIAKSALKDIEKSIDGTQDKVKKLGKTLGDDVSGGAGKATNKLQELDKVAQGLEKAGRAFGLTWVESLGSIMGQGTDLIEMLGQIKGLAGGGAAGLGGISAGVGFGLAGIAGVGLGAAGYEGARAAGLAQKGSASLGQFASVGAYGAGSLFGDETAQKWFRTVAEALGELPPKADKATKAVENFGNGLQAMPAIAANAVQQAQQAVASGSPSALGVGSIGASVGSAPGGSGVSLPTGGLRLTSRGGNRRYTAQLAQRQQQEQEELEQAESEQEERQYQNQRNQIIKAANAEAIRAERDFQRERKQAISTFNLESRHLQEDHNTQMKRAARDGAKRLDQLANERDAVSYIQEKDKIETERSDAESNFQQEMRQRQEQFDLRLKQEKDDFEALQATRAEQAQQELERLKSAHDAENDVRDQGYNRASQSAQRFANNLQGMFDRLASNSSRGGNSGGSTRSSTMASNSSNQQAAIGAGGAGMVR